MPRPSHHLEDWQDQLTQWILEEKIQQQEVLTRLRAAGITVSRSTLARRLNDWKISIAPKAHESDELRAKIADCHRLRLTDEQSLQKLSDEGYPVALGALSRVRRKMGLYKQVKPEQQEAEEQGIREALQKEFEQGTLGKFKRSELHEHMRTKYNFIGRDRMFKIAYTMNPDNAVRRIPNAANERRRERDRKRARLQGIPARRFKKASACHPKIDETAVAAVATAGAALVVAAAADPHEVEATHDKRVEIDPSLALLS